MSKSTQFQVNIDENKDGEGILHQKEIVQSTNDALQ